MVLGFCLAGCPWVGGVGCVVPEANCPMHGLRSVETDQPPKPDLETWAGPRLAVVSALATASWPPARQSADFSETGRSLFHYARNPHSALFGQALHYVIFHLHDFTVVIACQKSRISRVHVCRPHHPVPPCGLSRRIRANSCRLQVSAMSSCSLDFWISGFLDIWISGFLDFWISGFLATRRHLRILSH